jgi:vacuolar-type H+-ATPase subunit I/STV1
MDSQTIVIITALIGVLKGKDVWDYLKSRSESSHKGHDKVIDIYEKRIVDLEEEVKQLKTKQEELIARIQTKMLKSRGSKNKLTIN